MTGHGSVVKYTPLAPGRRPPDHSAVRRWEGTGRAAAVSRMRRQAASTWRGAATVNGSARSSRRGRRLVCGRAAS